MDPPWYYDSYPIDGISGSFHLLSLNTPADLLATVSADTRQPFVHCGVFDINVVPGPLTLDNLMLSTPDWT